LTDREPGAWFGEYWPSGLCSTGRKVRTPVGEPCALCKEPIAQGNRGSFMGAAHDEFGAYWLTPVHRECSLRSVLGGIGHLRDHQRWCIEGKDPDAGYTYRESALLVWVMQMHNGP
jgi:hypothetical protein